jgi:serine/threonine protein kinase
LQRLHDRGEIHGALTPANLKFTSEGLELLPPQSIALETITPYTAPEVLQGRTPDARCDVFAFGAILFEMLTGRRAFEGVNAAAPSSGSPLVDRLLRPCLAKNPDARPPRMQNVIRELKLLTVAARRAQAAAASRREMREVESRLQTHEKKLGHIQRSANEAMVSLKGLLSEVRSVLNEAEDRAAPQAPAATKEQLDAASQRILAEVDRSFQAMHERITVVERSIEGMKQCANQFERSVAAHLVELEQSIKAQATAIESARTAMSQTDDLVERVVDALESLQNAVLDGDFPMERPAFAIN